MKAFFAEPGMPSWEEAWSAIEAEFGDPACEDGETGEVWQYMGTFQRHDGRWQHEFRHRTLNGQRTYRKYPAASPETLH
jgi:hypothetical protein